LALEPETLPEQQIGPYQTSAFIGGGGFAWVVAAQHTDGTKVALKVLKPKYANDKQFTVRFLKEAETASQLRHPNIIRILDIGQDDKHVWFAMPRLKSSLDQLLEGDRSLPEDDVLRTSRDIARALAFAHDTGLVHRDIKPQNILFDGEGSAILTDFGIARAIAGYSSTTGKQLVLGTPHYIAPEQAQGLVLDGRTDIYALGVTMYRAATGQLPFRSSDWYELARLHVEQPPEPPRKRGAEISRAFEAVVLRCLAKNRDERYATAGALADELEALLAPKRTTAEYAIQAMKRVFGRKSG
jgi:eukaryotic-like serine/threonine-protein kinase